MRARPLVATAAALSLASAALAGPSIGASATAEPQVITHAKKLTSPLSLAVDSDGDRYFSQNFKGKLMRQAPGGDPQRIFRSAKGTEVGAVSVQEGVVTFAVSEGNNAKGTIYRMGTDDVVTRIAKIHPVEKKQNPDGAVRYGFRNLAPSCAKKIKTVPVSYRGVPETHPYASTTVDGTTYVADAGANAVYQIDETGTVSPLAVIPGPKVVVTQEAAEGFGLPDCAIGKPYVFESVPTDIEVGPDGKLYVTSLPGGPEDGSLGPLASVFSVKPGSGKVRKVVGGLVSATGLAVAENGDIYVAELFRGRIAKVKAGQDKAKTFIEVPLPSDVEIGSEGDVYALVGSLGKGKLVQITS